MPRGSCKPPPCDLRTSEYLSPSGKWCCRKKRKSKILIEKMLKAAKTIDEKKKLFPKYIRDKWALQNVEFFGFGSVVYGESKGTIVRPHPRYEGLTVTAMRPRPRKLLPIWIHRTPDGKYEYVAFRHAKEGGKRVIVQEIRLTEGEAQKAVDSYRNRLRSQIKSVNAGRGIERSPPRKLWHAVMRGDREQYESAKEEALKYTMYGMEKEGYWYDGEKFVSVFKDAEGNRWIIHGVGKNRWREQLNVPDEQIVFPTGYIENVTGPSTYNTLLDKDDADKLGLKYYGPDETKLGRISLMMEKPRKHYLKTKKKPAPEKHEVGWVPLVPMSKIKGQPKFEPYKIPIKSKSFRAYGKGADIQRLFKAFYGNFMNHLVQAFHDNKINNGGDVFKLLVRVVKEKDQAKILVKNNPGIYINAIMGVVGSQYSHEKTKSFIQEFLNAANLEIPPEKLNQLMESSRKEAKMSGHPAETGETGTYSKTETEQHELYIESED